MNRAYLEGLLVGVPLPAEKSDLVEYARAQREGARAAELLERIPDRSYRTLQEVGEELEPRQRRPQERKSGAPRAESGLPPGGEGYLGEQVEPANVAAVRRT